MKKAMTLLLLLVISVHIGGTYLIFRYQQLRVRKEIKLKLKLGVPENELNYIVVNNNNRHLLEWIHAREFRFRGTMYDIIRKRVINESTIEYCCINDKKEAALFARLDEEVSKNMAGRNHTGKTARNLFKLLCIGYPLPSFNDCFLDGKTVSFFDFQVLEPVSFSQEIPSPPPEWV